MYKRPRCLSPCQPAQIHRPGGRNSRDAFVGRRQFVDSGGMRMKMETIWRNSPGLYNEPV
jgi:hypothetical protein